MKYFQNISTWNKLQKLQFFNNESALVYPIQKITSFTLVENVVEFEGIFGIPIKSIRTMNSKT